MWEAMWRYGKRLGCHQLPERSFFWHGHQFPVCARCTGVYLGEITAIIAYILGVKSLIRLDIVFCTIMFLDWFLQFLKIRLSTNRRRMVTGIFGGYGFMNLQLVGVIYLSKIVFSMIS